MNVFNQFCVGANLVGNHLYNLGLLCCTASPVDCTKEPFSLLTLNTICSQFVPNNIPNICILLSIIYPLGVMPCDLNTCSLKLFNSLSPSTKLTFLPFECQSTSIIQAVKNVCRYISSVLLLLKCGFSLCFCFFHYLLHFQNATVFKMKLFPKETNAHPF